jgi:PleD family two-component response regulator/EAL domain-containing protein (putative c-di-GMP-specific phosphodiesterase class I)
MSVFAPQERQTNTGQPTQAGVTARAEFPPAAYWRRWCLDAPPPIAQRIAPEAVAPETEAETIAETPVVMEVAANVVPGDQAEPAYRVLIVEDDRSQAMFAQSVLRGAGMEAQVVSLASEMMGVLQSFHPDLVLMDMHMPGLSGTELTMQIRANPAYTQLPVVFLTGDTDPDSQVEALDSGGDDYLSKPVRPKHLVATVHNRIKRVRAMKAQREQEVRRHPVTGLLTRTFMLQQLGAAFPNQRHGAIHFLVVEGTSALRDRYGYAALDTILTESGRLIAQVASEHPSTRLNDNTFLLYSPDMAPEHMLDWAREMRDAFARHAFTVDGERLRLRACVGYVDLVHGFADAGAALAAAEEALRFARSKPNAIAAYEPPEDDVSEQGAAMLQQLQEALSDNRIDLAFQPIVSVVGSENVQYQTLMRLRDPSGQLRTAGEIMPLAERAGMVHEIDRRVLTRALAILEERVRSGRPARLFVPQAARSLGQEGYGQWLLEVLQAKGIDGSLLVIDVRLGDALVYAVLLREFCQRMVNAGVRLCLSHYQVNPESDALLAQLPLNYVRLSPHYSGNLEQPGVQDEMRLVIDRAHRLGLQVIGQHVENPQTAATLWLSGIDFLQGDLVQRVASAMDFDFQHSLL